MDPDHDGKDPFSTPTEDGDAITVHSEWKVWYYRKFKGYSVVRQTASPTPGMFGSIAYRKTWVLARDGDGAR